MVGKKAAKFAVPPRKADVKKRRRHTVVEEVIEAVNKTAGITPSDDPAELRRKLMEYGKRHIDPQLVYGWRQRGNFPRDWVPAVSKISGIPMERLIQYKSALFEDDAA